MVRIWLVFIIGATPALLSLTPAQGMSSLLHAELKRLDPQTRLEQRCDIEAMESIAKTGKYAPDKALAYAFSDPITTKDSINAKGAAFRSHGKWYHLSFFCLGTKDHLNIASFNYTLGAMVPSSQWAAHYLVP